MSSKKGFNRDSSKHTQTCTVMAILITYYSSDLMAGAILAL